MKKLYQLSSKKSLVTLCFVRSMVIANLKNRLLCLMVFTSLAMTASAQNWSTVNASRGNFSFQMPSAPTTVSTSNTDIYSLNTPEDIVFQVHFVDTTFIDTEDVSQVDFFCKTFLYTTKGELKSVNSINLNNGMSGKEIGVSHLNHATRVYTYIQVFYRNNKFYVSSITGNETLLQAITSYKSIFFNSTVFN